MAENLTVARPYAEAAYKLARDANALDAWARALERLAAVAGDAGVRESLGDPRIATEKLSRVFIEAAGDLSTEQQSFVDVLADNERLSLLPEILTLFCGWCRLQI